MKNINEIKKSLSCILFFCLCAELNAVRFDCNHLYIGGQNGRTNNYAEVTVKGSNSFSGVDFYVKPYSDNPSLALGPYKKEIVLYWWDYDMRTSAKSGSGSSSPIYYVRSNSQLSSVIPQSPSTIKLADRRLSGGTVNQKTGEIYLLTEPCSSTRSISILKPDQSGTFRLSNKSPNLDYTKNTACRAFSSDMAIDADGNAYLLVNTVDNEDYDKSEYGYKLVKVNPNDWSYDSIRLQNDIVIDDEYGWGMAFLNGKLYVATSKNPAVIHTIDPIKGGASSYGNVIMQDGRKYGYGIDDMASCQTASAITGRVYLDKNGDGKIDGNDKTNGRYQFVSNVIVEIYNSPTSAPIGSQYTNSLGEYSFLVELNKTYYVRIKQPQIHGVNTHQTWASGGEFSWQSTIGIGSNGINIATPKCHNADTPIYEKEQHQSWYSGNEVKKRYTKPCYGARPDGIDSSYSKISDANYYTKVEMKTDLSVVHADFAVANIDRSDAPSSFGEVSHVIFQNGAKMGSLIDADTRSLASFYADGDDNNGLKDEDGVEVRADDEPNGWKSLKNFNFNNGKYFFKVKVTKKGFLNAWVNINHKYVDLNNFASGIKIADNIEYNNNTGYIIFSADIDTKLDTDGGYMDGNKVSKLHRLFFRFRYSSYNALAFNITLMPTNPSKTSSMVNSQPWALDGEAEDYRASYRYVEKPLKPKGTLIIVNQNFNLKAGDKKSLNPTEALFALYTQITNKPFDVKMVYYDENGSGIAKTFENTNFSVKVDLVDFNGNCDTSPVVHDNVYAAVLKRSETIKTLPNIKISKAVKNGAFRITYGYASSKKYKTTCSPDLFAIRPKNFILEGNFHDKLIGGSSNKGRIKAVEYGSVKSVQNYNQAGSNIASNATLIAPPNCALSVNASGECHTVIRDFANGIADISVKYQNVGRINMELTDKEWTNIDGGKNDCIVNSAANTHNLKGIVGCDVAMNKNMNFIPNSFAVDVVMHNVYNGDFTYLSNESAMSAYVDTTVKAMLFDGTIAANYQKDCFAGNFTYDMALISDTPLGWGKRNHMLKKRLMFFQNNVTIADNNGGKNGIGTFKIEQEKFVNGAADNMRFGFNFGHFIAEAENPFRLNPAIDFSIVRAEDNDTNKADIAIGGDNITFFYGRAFIGNYEGESPIPAEVKYELFCRGCVRGDFGILLSLMSRTDNDWFLNQKHSDMHGNISSYAPRGMSLVTDKMAAGNGRGAIRLRNNSGMTPYQDVIRAVPRSWLINKPKNSIVHEIDFNVKFIGDISKDWAGKGRVSRDSKTGEVINANPYNKTSKKIEW